jgi:hypothetical protein
VTDAEALVVGAEDDLGGHDEARDADGVDLGAGDVRAARVRVAGDLVDRRSTCGARTSARRSASSRAVPLGASGLLDLA